MVKFKKTCYLFIVLVLSGINLPAQNPVQFSLLEAVDRAVHGSLQFAQIRESLNLAQAQYTLAELETRPHYTLNGPSASYSLEKRFNEPSMDSSYPARDRGWSGSIGLGVSRALPSGGRFDLGFDNTLSVSRFGDEQLAQVPRLSVSYSLPIIMDRQSGGALASGINLVLAENSIKNAELRERDMLNRLVLNTVRTCLELELLRERNLLYEKRIALYSSYLETADPGVAILYESALLSLEANLVHTRIWAQRLFAELAALIRVPEREADSISVLGIASINMNRLFGDTGVVGDSVVLVQAGLYLENEKLYASRQDQWKLPSVSFSGSVEPRYGSTRESDMNFLRSITDYSEPGSGFYVNAGINFRIPLGSAAEKSALSDRDQSRIASAELGLQELTERLNAELATLKGEKESLVQRLMVLQTAISRENDTLTALSDTPLPGNGDRIILRIAEYKVELHSIIVQLVNNRLRILELSGADITEEIQYLFGT